MKLYVTIDYMDIPPCVESRFSAVFREHGEICYIGRNECLELLVIWKCLCVIEEKYCSIYSVSREDYLPLKFENSAMKISKLFSVFECHGG